MLVEFITVVFTDVATHFNLVAPENLPVKPKIIQVNIDFGDNPMADFSSCHRYSTCTGTCTSVHSIADPFNWLSHSLSGAMLTKKNKKTATAVQST